jgi:hypothetical protein
VAEDSTHTFLGRPSATRPPAPSRRSGPRAADPVVAHAFPGAAQAAAATYDEQVAEDSKGTTQNFLVSHAEREFALNLLQDAMARGYVSADEFGERYDRALAARTRGDLDGTVRDIPEARIPYQETGSAVVVPAGEDEVVLRGTASSLKRGGKWVVPRKLVLDRQGGSVELDFSEAQFDHPVVEVELAMDRASLEIRVPAGASVSLDDVEVIRGSLEDHRQPKPGTGEPRFVFTGRVRRGSVEVRGPRRRLFG